MKVQVYSTLQIVLEKEIKGPANHTRKTQNEKDTRVPSFEKWDGGLKMYMYMYMHLTTSLWISNFWTEIFIQYQLYMALYYKMYVNNNSNNATT